MVKHLSVCVSTKQGGFMKIRNWIQRTIGKTIGVILRPTAPLKPLEPRMQYHAFISYKRKPDEHIAKALQGALQHLAKPFTRWRAIRVFRDVTSLPAGSDLGGEIRNKLECSEYMILLASREAFERPSNGNTPSWVEQELLHWFHRGHGAKRLLIARTGGEIVWDPNAKDFDWSKTSALPTSLRGRCKTEPIHIDLTWARDPKNEKNLTLSNGEFANAVAALASPIRGIDREKLFSEDLRQNRRRIRLFSGLAISVSLFALIATGLGLFARQQQIESERIASINLLEWGLEDCAAGNISAGLHRMVDAAETLPDTIWGEEAVYNTFFWWRVRETGLLGRENLQDAVNRGLSSWTPVVGDVFFHGGTTSGVQMIWSDFESQMIVDNKSGEVALWDLRTGLPAARFPYEGTAFSVRIQHEDERLLIAHDEVLSIWSLRTFKRLMTIKHPGSVAKLALHSERQLIATASSTDNSDYVIRLIDSPSYKIVKEFRVEGNVRSLTFSQGGTYLAAAGEFRDTRLISIEAGYPVRALTGKQGSMEAVFSPGESFLVTGHWGNEARVWDTKTGKLLKVLPHEGIVRTVRFHPSGEFFVTGSNDQYAHVFTTETFEEKYRLPHDGYIESLQFVGLDGQWLLTGCNDRQARLWNLQTGQLIGEPIRYESGCPLRAFVWNDQPLLVLCSQGNVVDVYSPLTGKPIFQPMIHQPGYRLGDIRVSDDQMQIWTFASDRTFRKTDLALKAPRHILAINTEVQGLTLNHKLDVVAVSTFYDGIRVIDREGQLLASVTVSDMATSPSGEKIKFSKAHFSEDGSVLIFSRETTDIYRWHWQTNEPPILITKYSDPYYGPPEVYPVGNNGACLVEGRYRDETIRERNDLTVFSPSGEVLAGPFDHQGLTAIPIVDQNGAQLIAGSASGTIRIWKLIPSPGKLIFEKDFDGNVLDIARSQSERYLALALSARKGRDGAIHFIDLETLRVLEQALPTQRSALSVEWSPEEDFFVSSSSDGSIRIWSQTLSENLPIARLIRGSSSFQLSLDGRSLFVARDNEIRIYDPKTAHTIGPPLRHTAAVKDYAVTTDATTLFVVTVDDEIWIWNINEQKLALEPDQWRMYVEVLTTQQRIPFSQVQSLLSPGEWEKRRERLHQILP